MSLKNRQSLSPHYYPKNTHHNFRLLSAHPEYPFIQKKLIQLQGNLEDLTLLTHTLAQFRYLTTEERFLRQSFQQGQLLRDSVFDEVFGQSQNFFYALKQHKANFAKKFQKQNFFILKSFKNQRFKVCEIFSKLAEYVILFGAETSRNPSNPLSQIRILYSESEQQTETYSKEQVLYILCLMGLNLVPEQQEHRLKGVQNNFNWNHTFSFIFSNVPLKTEALLMYFEDTFIKNDFITSFKSRISSTSQYHKFNEKTYSPKNISQKNQPSLNPYKNLQKPTNEFIIKRKAISILEQSLLMKRQTQMKQYDFLPDNLTMEDYILPTKQQIKNLSNQTLSQNYMQKVQVDFANKHISGGSLMRGMVQEEIIYMNHPELFITIVLCESLKDNEALYYKGFKKYFRNIGYGRSLSIFEREDPVISTLQSNIVAIDATDYKSDEGKQYEEREVEREIVKAYAGFSCVECEADIVTGNWGCGVFQGDHQLKFMIQWIAGSLANRSMIHCPYGQEKRIFRKVEKSSFLKRIQGIKVSEVYDILLKVCQKKKSNSGWMDLIEKISEQASKYDFKEIEKDRGANELREVKNNHTQGVESEMLDQKYERKNPINNQQQRDQIYRHTANSFNQVEGVSNTTNPFRPVNGTNYYEGGNIEKNSISEEKYDNLDQDSINQIRVDSNQNKNKQKQQCNTLSNQSNLQFYPVVESHLY